MEKERYIRIRKVIEIDVDGYFYEVLWTTRKIYEFYFTSVANCARWLGVSYNAVKFCLRGDYTLCDGYTIEYVSEKPDERSFYIDPDKYRNPEVRKALDLPEGGVGMFFPGK